MQNIGQAWRLSKKLMATLKWQISYIFDSIGRDRIRHIMSNNVELVHGSPLQNVIQQQLAGYKEGHEDKSPGNWIDQCFEDPSGRATRENFIRKIAAQKRNDEALRDVDRYISGRLYGNFQSHGANRLISKQCYSSLRRKANEMKTSETTFSKKRL